MYVNGTVRPAETITAMGVDGEIKENDGEDEFKSDIL
jgi:hypothetical protein